MWEPTVKRRGQIRGEWMLRWFNEEGYLHRDGGGPAVIHSSGAQSWYKHGRLHREDGPAHLSPTGFELWKRHGKLHRTGGPAITFSDGSTRHWEHGTFVG